MMYSPTFKHSIESFQHGLEHYLEGSPLSRKFAFLHVDHAIELLLKEKLKQLGESIYKSNDETLNIHEVIKSLERKKISVCEKPRIEDLHGIRNLIQHTGHTPDEDETKYYIELSYNFYKNFMMESMEDELSNHIGRHYIRLMEGVSKEEEKIDKMIIQVDKEIVTSPSNAILRASRILEYLLDIYRVKKGYKPFRPHFFIDEMVKEKLLDKSDRLQFHEIWKIRNKVAHTLEEPTKNDAEQFYGTAKKLIEKIKVKLKDYPDYGRKHETH